MYIINLTYTKPLTEVEKYLPDHITYLDKYYSSGNFICSGRKNPRDGGIILCHAKNHDEINQIISEDPFYREKISTYEIIEFYPTKYVDSLKAYI